jgi:hypothetical protein
MQKSIYEKSLMDLNLECLISPFQKKILDAFNLNDNVVGLAIVDPVTTEKILIGKWGTPNKEESVYDYMKRSNLNIDELELRRREIDTAGSIYDPRKEATGL